MIREDYVQVDPSSWGFKVKRAGILVNSNRSLACTSFASRSSSTREELGLVAFRCCTTLTSFGAGKLAKNSKGNNTNKSIATIYTNCSRSNNTRTNERITQSSSCYQSAQKTLDEKRSAQKTLCVCGKDLTFEALFFVYGKI